jgi:hypothetical protein
VGVISADRESARKWSSAARDLPDAAGPRINRESREAGGKESAKFQDSPWHRDFGSFL